MRPAERTATTRAEVSAARDTPRAPRRCRSGARRDELNSRYGDNLLIGVADDGTIHGLEDDYKSFSKRGQRGDHDLFGQHLQNLLVGRLGPAAASLVGWEFHTIDGHDLCRVSVEPADFPVYEGTGDDDRRFWWRYPTGTTAIDDATEQQRIIRRRFGNGGGSAKDL